MSNNPHIAVIGSGPAALGVVTALTSHLPTARVTLLDHGTSPATPVLEEFSDATVKAYYDELYSQIWATQRRAFPPPKTHFARKLPKYLLDGRERILRSEAFGGLSNFWGGTCLPFTQREFTGWPVDRAQMEPHYRRMSEVVGISGRDDALSEYFGSDFINRPPMHQTPLVSSLERSANAAPLDDNLKIVAGVNRCALETRPNLAATCIQCGECLAGCLRSSIFSAGQSIQAHVSARRIEHVRANVRRFDPDSRVLEIEREGAIDNAGPFDRIYLAAGCPSTTEIVIRSLRVKDATLMADNAVYVFPILYMGAYPKDVTDRYLSLTNLIIGLIPRAPALHFAQVQIYSNFDYMWRYNVPPALWPLIKRVVRWSQGRLLWARLYMHGDLSQSYRLSLRNDALHFEHGRNADTAAAGRLMNALRSTLNRDGFLIPPGLLIRQKANTHYAGTLPYGGSIVPVTPDAQIAPGVFVCDASVFPSLPAVSLTFTIMANAHRIALESL